MSVLKIPKKCPKAEEKKRKSKFSPHFQNELRIIRRGEFPCYYVKIRINERWKVKLSFIPTEFHLFLIKIVSFSNYFLPFFDTFATFWTCLFFSNLPLLIKILVGTPSKN